MSDDAYASFLDKANQDTSGPSTSSAAPKSLKTTDANQPVPQSLKSLDEIYVSDTDSPFEPVALSFSGKSSELDEKCFAELVEHKGEVEELTVKQWDPKGKYKGVTDAVKGAIEGNVKIFKAQTQGARVEYFIVGVDGDGRVVGVRAKAVES